MNTQMKEYRKATLRLAYLLTLMLWTGSCIDMDINLSLIHISEPTRP